MKSFLLSVILVVSFIGRAEVRFVRVMFNSNASSEAVIGWDQLSGRATSLLYGEEKANDYNFANGDSSFLINSAKGLHSHFIRLTGLKANQRYYFAIKDSEGYSKIYYFSTVPNTADLPLSFIAGGDSRDRRETRSKGNLMVAKLKAHAVLFNGDFTGIDTPNQWEEWFTDWELAVAEDGRITPLVVSRGNHELTNKVMVDLFDVPHKKVFYTTTFGGDLINVISLNSEILKFLSQKQFLRKSLKNHANFYWQLPQYHRPVRSHVSHKKEMETQYKHFVPLFEKYPNVRLCLENDSHTCKVTWPVVRSNEAGSEEGFIRNDSIGIVYAGEGCWGAPLRPADDVKCWTRDAEAVNQIQWIFVTKEKIELRTILYENAEEVEELTEDQRFNFPQNIHFWSPSNGELVEIYPRTTK